MPDAPPLAGKRAIVIGGGSGIGLGSARHLARDGARVTGQLLTVDGGHTLRAFVDYAELLRLPDTKSVILHGEQGE